MSKPKKTTTRVQMELPQLSINRLQVLKEKTEAASYAEVTKNAYRLYDMLIEMQEAGNSFMVKSPDGDMKELQIFI